MLLRTAGSIAGGLLAAEGLLRLFTDRAVLATSHHRLFCEFDPQLGWRKKPNGRGFHVTPEYQVYERFNSRGLRSREFDIGNAKHERRILFLGDSYAEGYSVHFHELFSERLELELNARGDAKYRSINAGTGGYSTDQELLYFQNEGREFQPDLTILMFYENDLMDNTAAVTHRGFRKPLYRVDRDERAVPVNLPLEAPATKSDPRRPSLGERVIGQSHLLSMIAASLQQIAVIAEMAQRKFATRRLDYEIPMELRVWEHRPPESIEQAWQLTTALIAELRRSVEDAGSRLLVFYVPPEAAVYPELFTTMCNVWGMERDRVSPDTVGRRLGEWCAAKQLRFINASDEFRVEARRLERNGSARLYYPLDGHWTRAGHALAARILGQSIDLAAHTATQSR